MIRKSLIAAFLASATLCSAPAQAEPIGSLEECYNAVITWCTETFPDHADQCGQSSGLNDCDDEFGNAASGLGVNRVGPALSARSFARLMSGAERRGSVVLRAASR